MVKTNDRRKIAMGAGKKQYQRPASQVTDLVRHHTGVQVDQSMEILEGYWKRQHGWDNGGYHEVIHPDGSLDLNYDPTHMTWGVGNQNHYTMHISLIGNGKFTEAQERTWEERALYHMRNLGIPISRVKGHNEYPGHYTNNCPGVDMNKVRNRLKELLTPKPVVKAPLTTQNEGVIDMQGTFVANDTIIVRDQPTTKARHIATYKKGESLIYEAVHFKNGYVWLQYARAVGGKGYIPIAPLAEMWGTLK